jgi:hypothetical protein
MQLLALPYEIVAHIISFSIPEDPTSLPQVKDFLQFRLVCSKNLPAFLFIGSSLLF